MEHLGGAGAAITNPAVVSLARPPSLSMKKSGRLASRDKPAARYMVTTIGIIGRVTADS
jgi:hypothetical protein